MLQLFAQAALRFGTASDAELLISLLYYYCYCCYCLTLIPVNIIDVTTVYCASNECALRFDTASDAERGKEVSAHARVARVIMILIIMIIVLIILLTVL